MLCKQPSSATRITDKKDWKRGSDCFTARSSEEHASDYPNRAERLENWVPRGNVINLLPSTMPLGSGIRNRLVDLALHSVVYVADALMEAYGLLKVDLYRI